jgi:competence protein ComEA
MAHYTPAQLRASLLLVLPAFAILALNTALNRAGLQETRFSETTASDLKTADSLLALLQPGAGPEKTGEKEPLTANAPGPEKNRLSLRLFDPNTVSRTEWQEMGLSPRVFNGLERYRLKGGRFRSASQIRKLYHLDPEVATALIPWIRLDSARNRPGRPAWKNERRVKPPFNLNEADTSRLKEVFGIGRWTALRIWKYREALGGFVHSGQLYEIYRLDSAVIDELLQKSYLPDPPAIRKIALNEAGEEELSQHPYIRKYLARILVAYRRQHGPYAGAESLKQIRNLREEDRLRLLPYLDFGDRE